MERFLEIINAGICYEKHTREPYYIISETAIKELTEIWRIREDKIEALGKDLEKLRDVIF